MSKALHVRTTLNPFFISKPKRPSFVLKKNFIPVAFNYRMQEELVITYIFIYSNNKLQNSPDCIIHFSKKKWFESLSNGALCRTFVQLKKNLSRDIEDACNTWTCSKAKIVSDIPYNPVYACALSHTQICQFGAWVIELQ